MFGAQFVQDVGGVEAGVVAQLSGDDLQGLGVCADQQLLFSGDGSGVIPQVLRQLHLNGTSPRYDGVVLEIKFSQLVVQSFKPINRGDTNSLRRFTVT